MKHDGTLNKGGDPMLHQLVVQFMDNCKLAGFSERSIQALSARLNEFNAFLEKEKFPSIQDTCYLDLVAFVSDFGTPSVHARKQRIWALRQFYHFLTLHEYVPENIATNLPYPKIEKTVPQFLTQDEYRKLLQHFCRKATDLAGQCQGTQEYAGEADCRLPGREDYRRNGDRVACNARGEDSIISGARTEKPLCPGTGDYPAGPRGLQLEPVQDRQVFGNLPEYPALSTEEV
jgi:hypothetical protein